MINTLERRTSGASQGELTCTSRTYVGDFPRLDHGLSATCELMVRVYYPRPAIPKIDQCLSLLSKGEKPPTHL
jgi:hypothetical protein